MSLQLRLFGGGKSRGDTRDLTAIGDHAIDKSKVLAATAPGVITPLNPGNFTSIRTAPIVPNPTYCDRETADALQDLAKEKTEGARHTKRAYKALGKIEEADAAVHKAHRKYEGVVAENELGKKRADGRLAKKLHSMRPGYARLGLGIDKADRDARAGIDSLKTRLTQVNN